MLSGSAARLNVAAQVDRDLRARSANESTEARPEVALHPGGQWKQAVKAPKFVTYETVLVWSGVKSGGNNPADVYARVDGLDTTGALTVEAVFERRFASTDGICLAVTVLNWKPFRRGGINDRSALPAK